MLLVVKVYQFCSVWGVLVLVIGEYSHNVLVIARPTATRQKIARGSEEPPQP